MKHIEYIYLHESNISSQEYLNFLRKYYHDRAEYRLYKRYKWYKEYLGFHCLLALKSNEIIGQSCAFKVRMMTPRGEQDWWWGCDSFVLEEARGKGVGKGMQKKLFDDHPNFSSLGYSRINGHIKKQMGAITVAKSYPSLYAIDCYFSALLSLIASKICKLNIVIKLPKLKLTFGLNSSIRDIVITESSFTEENCKYIENILSKQFSYYIIRDRRYLTWKYDDNPSVKYHLLELRRSGYLIGIIIISIAYKRAFCGYPLNMVKLLDYFVDETSKISLKHIVRIIQNFFSKKGQHVNGIVGINKGDYIWTITHPRNGKELLSSYPRIIENSYFSMSDQDLDQIRVIEESF